MIKEFKQSTPPGFETPKGLKINIHGSSEVIKKAFQNQESLLIMGFLSVLPSMGHSTILIAFLKLFFYHDA
jgi:hypothetical protein